MIIINPKAISTHEIASGVRISKIGNLRDRNIARMAVANAQIGGRSGKPLM